MCYSALAVSGHYCLQVTIAPAYPNICFVFRFELILGQYVLQVIVCEQRNSSHWELTGEGQLVAKNGSHEALIFNYLSPEGTTQAELIVRGWMDFEKCSVLCSVIAFTDCSCCSQLYQNINKYHFDAHT